MPCHMAAPSMTTMGSRSPTLASSGTAVAGVRAVATVNSNPRRAMSAPRICALSALTSECSLSKVPSRSLTKSVWEMSVIVACVVL